MASSISVIVEEIRTATYGREVRENIALGIETCYSDVEEGTTLVDAAIEQARETNQQIQDAEADRAAAEINREKAEKGPNLDGNGGRVKAEADRVAAENAREIAEKGPNKDGNGGRVKAEANRAAAEVLRVNAENTRNGNEGTRQTNEVARQKAIQNMSVAATARAYDQQPTVTISDVDGHKHIVFGLVPGHPFVIKKSFASISAMNSYSGSDIKLYDFAVIASNVEDPDNAKMYMKSSAGTGANTWTFITDLSGSQGIQGPKGDTGNGIASAVVNADYTLTLTFTNGSTYTSGSIRGTQGPKGDTGKGVSSAVINANYQLVVTYTDGGTYTSGSLRGPQGIQGIQGEKGEKGDKGDKGDKGEPGSGGAEVSYDTTSQKLTITFG